MGNLIDYNEYKNIYIYTGIYIYIYTLAELPALRTGSVEVCGADPV